MKYKFIILFSFLCFLMLIGCSNASEKTDNSSKEHDAASNDRAEEAAYATVDYFKHVRDKDVEYVIRGMPAFYAHLIQMKKEVDEEEWKKGEESLFNEFKKVIEMNPEIFWQGWPNTLNGTEIEIVGYQPVERMYKTSLKAGGPVVQFPQISEEAYTVSLQLTFTKTSSAPVRDGIFLKKAIYEFPVYYYKERYLVDVHRVRRIPVGDELWSQ